MPGVTGPPLYSSYSPLDHQGRYASSDGPKSGAACPARVATGIWRAAGANAAARKVAAVGRASGGSSWYSSLTD